jgi:hypothetical protein
VKSSETGGLEPVARAVPLRDVAVKITSTIVVRSFLLVRKIEREKKKKELVRKSTETSERQGISILYTSLMLCQRRTTRLIRTGVHLVGMPKISNLTCQTLADHWKNEISNKRKNLAAAVRSPVCLAAKLELCRHYILSKFDQN